jgi:putative endonuclease
LEARGYSILARNYRCRWGGIDIVARQGATLVFVEVRTRTGAYLGAPQESLDPRKQSRLRRLAAYYLHRHGLGEVDCRFDVVAITAEAGGKNLKLELFVNAF